MVVSWLPRWSFRWCMLPVSARCLALVMSSGSRSGGSGSRRGLSACGVLTRPVVSAVVMLDLRGLAINGWTVLIIWHWAKGGETGVVNAWAMPAASRAVGGRCGHARRPSAPGPWRESVGSPYAASLPCCGQSQDSGHSCVSPGSTTRVGRGVLGSVVIFTVIPAKAGIQRPLAANAYLPATGFWVPAFAGMTETDARRPIFLN